MIPDADDADVLSVFLPEQAAEAVLDLERIGQLRRARARRGPGPHARRRARRLRRPARRRARATGRWRVFLDHKQNVFDAVDRRQYDRISRAATTQFQLFENCRNTPEINDITALLAAVEPDEPLAKSGPEVDAALRPGRPRGRRHGGHAGRGLVSSRRRAARHRRSRDRRGGRRASCGTMAGRRAAACQVSMVAGGRSRSSRPRPSSRVLRLSPPSSSASVSSPRARRCGAMYVAAHDRGPCSRSCSTRARARTSSSAPSSSLDGCRADDAATDPIRSLKTGRSLVDDCAVRQSSCTT